MASKKKSIWRMFRPVALVVVALVTSIFASKSPELSPVINAVGSAVQKVIMVATITQRVVLIRLLWTLFEHSKSQLNKMTLLF